MSTKKTISILLVEDDAGDAEFLCEILSDQVSPSYKVDCAHTLQQALERLTAASYDILIVDLSLPDSVGLDTFRKLSDRAPALPILVLTGLDDEQMALDALRQGAQDYIVKGRFDVMLLAKSIQYAIERNRIHLELTTATEQLSEANQRLDRLAHNDALTNLLNRRGLEKALSREVAWAHRHGSSLMAIIIDLDDFKKINDTLGHSTGDAVLTELARRMKEPLRTTDFAARIGGDEFLLLLPDTELNEGVKIAEKVRAAIGGSGFPIGTETVEVTVSIGAIPVSESVTSLDDLLTDTHDVLYRSKKEGKNRVSFDERRRDVLRPDRALNALEEFQAKNKFQSVAQPIYDLSKDQVVGYEFFARSSVQPWERPEEFFRISEKPNFILNTDRECFMACFQAAQSLPAHLRRHINISPPTISEAAASYFLLRALESVKKSEKYCLEISQQQIVGDPSYLIKPVKILKTAGYLIALDHAALSQSTLEALILLQPNFLKIDRHSIGVSQDPAKLRSIKRLLLMAESLGIEVIAAAVESKDDLEILKELGVTCGQGFLWGQLIPN